MRYDLTSDVANMPKTIGAQVNAAVPTGHDNEPIANRHHPH